MTFMPQEVTVSAFGLIKDFLPEGTTVAAGQTVGQAVAGLGLGIGEALAVVVNERVVSWNYMLQPGDHLQLIPAIGGG